MSNTKDFDVQKAVEALRSRGVKNFSCPFCGGRDFNVESNLATIHMSNSLESLNLGHYIPAAAMVCVRCGNIQFFALGALGMLPDRGAKDNG